MNIETTVTQVFDVVRQIEAEILDTRLFWVIAAFTVASLL